MLSQSWTYFSDPLVQGIPHNSSIGFKSGFKLLHSMFSVLVAPLNTQFVHTNAVCLGLLSRTKVKLCSIIRTLMDSIDRTKGQCKCLEIIKVSIFVSKINKTTKTIICFYYFTVNTRTQEYCYIFIFLNQNSRENVLVTTYSIIYKTITKAVACVSFSKIFRLNTARTLLLKNYYISSA